MKKNGIIGGFRIFEEIHGGGQGKLFKAVCETPSFDGIEPGAVVALKVMPVVDDEGGRQWTQLQARMNAPAKLSHPNVVKYYGCFSEQDSFGDLFVAVMEFLDGETLKDRLARNPSGLDADEALRIAMLAIKGLAYTSDSGIVHRDVKPSNIFLCNDGGVKLIDLDKSFVIEGSTETDNTAGNIYGTFDYMAPEFANPRFHGDVKSDVFSMGVVLHEMLTGEKPYKREECADRQAIFAFLSRWANVGNGGENPIRISSRVNRILAHANEVLLRALDPDREKRYADFADFYRGLKGVKVRELTNGDSTYRMLGFIGKGGFCEVFKARHVQSGETVAIKHLLKPEFARRFRSEAKAMERLRGNSRFVQLRDFFEVVSGIDRGGFLVMDYLPGMPGCSLRDAIRRAAENGERLSENDILLAFTRYAQGLAAMHKANIIHRDIKPYNLYFPPDPHNAAIMDFTIVRDMNSTVSTDGTVPGTLDYMPPEIVKGESRGDARSDIYALGLSLYEALTGKTAYPPLPPRAEALETFYKRAKNKEQPSFDSPVVTSRPKLLALLKDMTNIDPAQRIQDAAEVERRLSGFAAIMEEQVAPDLLCLEAPPPYKDIENETQIHKILRLTSEDIPMSDICLQPDEISTENPATLDCTIEDETEMNVSADGFECVRVIGRGGQSVVYEAVCKKSVFEGIKVGSRVALKVLNGYGSDDDLRKFNNRGNCKTSLGRGFVIGVRARDEPAMQKMDRSG